jgi:hypothetical protein
LQQQCQQKLPAICPDIDAYLLNLSTVDKPFFILYVKEKPFHTIPYYPYF